MVIVKQYIDELVLSLTDPGWANFLAVHCPRINKTCQNAGPVFQTEEGVIISEKLSSYRASNSQGIQSTSLTPVFI